MDYLLIDVTLHISLNTGIRKAISKAGMDIERIALPNFVPVIFHRPEEEGAILKVWEFLHGKFYHLILLLVFSLLNLSNGLVSFLDAVRIRL